MIGRDSKMHRGVAHPGGIVASLVGATSPDEALEARFRAFVATHRDRAVSTAWRLVGDDGAAEDIAQDAFLLAWRALARFRGDAQLSTWFYRILVRQAHNHRRWRGVRHKWHDLFRDPDETPSAAPPSDTAARAQIATAIDRLSRGQRETFVLVHLEGFTVNEAAEVLGKAPGTVKSHLHRALVALRRDLAALVEGDDS